MTNSTTNQVINDLFSKKLDSNAGFNENVKSKPDLNLNNNNNDVTKFIDLIILFAQSLTIFLKA